MICPASRKEALERVACFAKEAPRYAARRNFVGRGSDNASGLSPAVRHRLVTEWELALAACENHSFPVVEKFVQEVYWRSYWKSWLWQRPQVWTDYLAELAQTEDVKEAVAIREGRGPIAVMNHFARELVETGYLHNHARMWFAGYWIHIARLPWVLGAKFFQDHLLDFDPASNTLSWRWVAGLQTLGKTYLPRRSNIEKYLDPEILSEVGSEGLELLEKPEAVMSERIKKMPPQQQEAEVLLDSTKKTGVWIHPEDLTPETSPLLVVAGPRLVSGLAIGLSHLQRDFQQQALNDAAVRNGAKEGTLTEDLSETLVRWAQESTLDTIVALRPDVGPLHDRISEIRERLNDQGIELCLLSRPEDQFLRPLGCAGFFPFWKKLQKNLRQGSLF